MRCFGHCKEIRELTFRALALCQSDSHSPLMQHHTCLMPLSKFILFTGSFTTRVVKEYFHLDIARLLCRYFNYLYCSVWVWRICVKPAIGAMLKVRDERVYGDLLRVQKCIFRSLVPCIIKICVANWWSRPFPSCFEPHYESETKS